MSTAVAVCHTTAVVVVVYHNNNVQTPMQVSDHHQLVNIVILYGTQAQALAIDVLVNMVQVQLRVRVLQCIMFNAPCSSLCIECTI